MEYKLDQGWNAEAYLCIKIVLKLMYNITALYCLLHMQEKKRERALYGGRALKFAMHCWITGWTRHQLAPLLFYFSCEIKKEQE